MGFATLVTSQFLNFRPILIARRRRFATFDLNIPRCFIVFEGFFKHRSRAAKNHHVTGKICLAYDGIVDDRDNPNDEAKIRRDMLD